MKKVTLYSRSNRAAQPDEAVPDEVAGRESPPPEAPASNDARASQARAASSAAIPAQGEPVSASMPRRRRWLRRPSLLGVFATFMTAVVIAGGVFLYSQPPRQVLTQKDIDTAVMRTISTHQLPSQAARSYAAIRPSVVRIRGLGHEGDSKDDIEKSVGSGVVIVDNGMILTNLHVVAGAEKLKVVFFDGTESDAFVISTQPENDLAVVQARTLPDDLVAATLRSTKDLQPGDEVIAVGFPFGIGPSVSSGVVSGLRREYRSADGTRQLSNLIQFDAAANPGSSGGPLVTTDGAVVGIVTGILNRGDQRVFIGIGFAVPIENAAAGIGLAPF